MKSTFCELTVTSCGLHHRDCKPNQLSEDVPELVAMITKAWTVLKCIGLFGVIISRPDGLITKDNMRQGMNLKVE